MEQAVSEYRREARRLQDVASGHTENARAYLERTAVKYDAVMAAANMVGLAGAMAIAGFAGAVAAGVKALNLVIGRSVHVAGEAAEGLALRALGEELGFKVVPFDRRIHGFDGILQGPNGQLVVLESKHTGDGKLHLTPDSYGHKQASVGWVAHVAQEMTNPASELYSPVNAQIGQQMLDSGPANVPVLGVVSDPATGRLDTFLRRDAAANEWTPLFEDLPSNLGS